MLVYLIILLAVYFLGMAGSALLMQASRGYSVVGKSPAKWFLQSLSISWVWPLLALMILADLFHGRGMRLG